MIRSLLTATLLLAGASAVAMPPKVHADTEKSADKADKLICKRFIETGSLVKGYRTCKTKRDWERERDAVRSNAHSANSCANQAEAGTC